MTESNNHPPDGDATPERGAPPDETGTGASPADSSLKDQVNRALLETGLFGDPRLARLRGSPQRREVVGISDLLPPQNGNGDRASEHSAHEAYFSEIIAKYPLDGLDDLIAGHHHDAGEGNERQFVAPRVPSIEQLDTITERAQEIQMRAVWDENSSSTQKDEADHRIYEYTDSSSKERLRCRVIEKEIAEGLLMIADPTNWMLTPDEHANFLAQAQSTNDDRVGKYLQQRLSLSSRLYAKQKELLASNAVGAPIAAEHNYHRPWYLSFPGIFPRSGSHVYEKKLHEFRSQLGEVTAINMSDYHFERLSHLERALLIASGVPNIQRTTTDGASTHAHLARNWDSYRYNERPRAPFESAAFWITLDNLHWRERERLQRTLGEEAGLEPFGVDYENTEI